MISKRLRKGMIRTAIVLLNDDVSVPEIIRLLCVVHHQWDKGEIAETVRKGIKVYNSLVQAFLPISRKQLEVDYITSTISTLDLITTMTEKGLRFIHKERLDMLLVKERLQGGG